MSRRARSGAADHQPPAWIVQEPVQRWMRQPVVTIGDGATVREATALMREREIRHLPVLDGGQRLVGIVTDRDLRHVLLDVALGDAPEDAERAGDVPVRQVMTWGVVTVRPTTDLREAARVMRERRLGGLPVIDDAGRLVGMLTERDLLDALQALLRERVARPGAAAGEPGGVYEHGLRPPRDLDPWRNTGGESGSDP
jgi:CBS domain-containing protein